MCVGLLLRMFMNLYNFEVIEEDAFMQWKEELNDVHPGKGQALFQVRWSLLVFGLITFPGKMSELLDKSKSTPWQPWGVGFQSPYPRQYPRKNLWKSPRNPHISLGNSTLTAALENYDWSGNSRGESKQSWA